MEIRFRNIGMVEFGEVKLDDITVIAGENDSGKSTLGKLVYSLVKAGVNYEADYNDYVIRQLTKISKRAYRFLRQNVDLNLDEIKYNRLSPSIFERRLKYSSHSLNEIFEVGQDYLYQYKSTVEYVGGTKLRSFDKYMSQLYDALDSIRYGLSRDSLMSSSLSKTLAVEFKNDISTKPTKDYSSISVREGHNNILEVTLNNSKIIDINVFDEINYPDVTYIESPMILNSRYRSGHISGDRNTDLINKLTYDSSMFDYFYDEHIVRYSNSMRRSESENIEFEGSSIKKIIGGNIEYNVNENEFYFKKNNRIKYSIDNVASGVKSFGILELLIKNNVLEPDSLLIIDEPEVHLHPSWQIEYGRLICELAKNDIKILVSTHSPYIVEAINYFSQRYDINQNVNFYTTEKHEKRTSVIENCNNDLNRIFKKLSDPIETLVWGEYNA